ncbi:MAG TPA: cysteine desulfurase family protein [Patescibacteria group bacterium]|nr:cysteine desulfurase family protein [Patescibacteria group bacterium]
MIYLDHASTTPLDKEVAKAMAPFGTKNFGNPSSLYKLGRAAAEAVRSSRLSVAKILNCLPGEIIFTAGGTESDNLAIFGIANQFLVRAKDYHLITTNIEHSAVLNSFRALEKKGFAVTYLPVDKYGLITAGEVMKALRPNTLFVSIIYANNEIGVIQPIAEIAQVIKNYRHIQRVDTVSKEPRYPIFHTDACQAAGYLDLNIANLGVDLMTLNGSKIYGPKQVGILYKNKNIKLEPLLCGGDQEFGLRPGTENVAGVIGFTKALELVSKNKNKEATRLTKLRNYFIIELLKIKNTSLNGHPTLRLPNNVNVSFLGVEGESVMLKLDHLGIYVSTGSACHSLSLEPSHVILALGQDVEYAHGSIRFTLGQSTTKKDLDQVLKVLPGIINDLRKMSAVR